jgi:hypothetical protein
MYKYLYGKKKYLQDLIEGKQGIRLSDLAYYSIMENEKMRDDELAKNFVIDKDKVQFSVNGFTINSQDMTENPMMTLYPQRCFCVCFSGKKDDPELFERFEADVCIEIDVQNLVELLTVAVSRFEGIDVVHREVSYYPSIMASAGPDMMSVLFYKRDIYEVENEYRIALTIPAHRKNFKGPDGESIAIFSDDPKDIRHMFVNGTDPSINLSYITSVGYPS